jgi:carboxynorspermidine decarboxylase
LTIPEIDKILELAPSPAYVVNLGKLRANLAMLDEVQRRSGAKILLALKGFSMWSLFGIISQTLQGVCASSPWEARLGREEFGREVHSFAAGLREADVTELLGTSNHLVFNSFNQLERFRSLWQPHSGRVSIGCTVPP